MGKTPSQLPPLLKKHFPDPQATSLELWDEQQVLAYQRDAVAEQLQHVGQNNPFYREKFAQAGVSPEDFHQLSDLGRFPFTEKDELRGKPWLLLSVPRDDVILAHTSTGTTGGVWSYNLYSFEDLYVRDLLVLPRVLLEIESADVVINALPYEMSSAGQSFQRSIQGAIGAMVVPVGKGGFYSDVHKTAAVMQELEATVLITTPPYAMVLLEAAERQGIVPGKDINLRLLWLTGEGCSPAYRRRLEERWQCQARVFYGSLECGPIALEGPERNGLHLSAGHIYLEIIDPRTGEQLPPGEVGEVVCTILQRRASPLIRYRTHDLGMIDPEPAKGRFQLPRLHLRGRIVDQVQQSSGSAASPSPPSLSPIMIEDVLYAHAAMGGNYQIYLDEAQLQIDAEYAGAASQRETAKQQLESALAERDVQAKLKWVDHIPRSGGKTRRVRPLAERESVMAQPCVLRGNEIVR